MTDIGPCIKKSLICLFVLFIWSLSSHSRIFHSYRDVTIAGKGLQSLTYARHSCMATEHGGFFNVPLPLWHGPTVYNGHLRGPVTLAPVLERLAVELSLPSFTT